MVTVNPTVVYRKNALNANFVKKIKLTSSASLQHCAQYRLQNSLCDFSSTQAGNISMSDHYAPNGRGY